ncbi:MAG: hypothetical protein EON60_05900 [Alphaproteobacteria bacterium]|nr:MAG: hypothetical protein EON60_05900 [Alphaproteobacteria bacterium]
MQKRNLMLGVAAVAAMSLALTAPAFAQTSGSELGSSFFESLTGAITGNIGFFLGLLLAVWGIWVWVVQQKTGAGVMMIIGGVLITLTPSLFTSIRNFAGNALSTVNGGSNTVTKGAAF